jgi:hypothetical protein
MPPESMMKQLMFLLASLLLTLPGYAAHGNEKLIADPERSYVLETEISATLTVHGDQWVLQAEFPRADVLVGDRLLREMTLRPRRAQLHFGPHVDIAFRVPAGPPVPPAFRDHVSYDAADVQVRFIPQRNPQKREVLVLITPFVANGKTYQIKASTGDDKPIPLKIRVPLP